MKRILISFGTVVAIAFYALFVANPNTTPVVPNIALNGQNNAPTGGTTDAATTTPTPNNPAKPSQRSKKQIAGMFKDGTYTGPVADAFYGPLQVAAVIQDGKLVDVKALQYPSDRQTSNDISLRSLPILTQEAISTQSANVDIVSGATQISEAFQQSLGAALAMAK